MKNSDEQEDIPATNKAQEKHQAMAISALGRAIRLAETFQRLGVEAQDAVKANGWLMTREEATEANEDLMDLFVALFEWTVNTFELHRMRPYLKIVPEESEAAISEILHQSRTDWEFRYNLLCYKLRKTGFADMADLLQASL